MRKNTMRMMRSDAKKYHTCPFAERRRANDAKAHSRDSNSGSPDSHRLRGFSLIETLVYVGLLALVLLTVGNTTLLMSRATAGLRASRHLHSSAVTVLDRVVRDIRNAESVNVGASTLGTSPGVLTLQTTTATGSAQTLQFYVSGGAVRVKQDGGDVGPLTLPDVRVDSLMFRHLVTPLSEAVKIEAAFSAGSGSSTRTANFYSTARLRDSY